MMPSVGKSLWAWLDADAFAYDAFMHTCICPRIWAYHRLSGDASPLFELSKQVFKKDRTFWATWFLCPELINLGALRTHFTAHSWLNWSITMTQASEMLEALMKPRTHLRAMPTRAAWLLVYWASGRLTRAALGGDGFRTLLRIGAYITCALSVWRTMATFGKTYRYAKLISNGRLSADPREWEVYGMLGIVLRGMSRGMLRGVWCVAWCILCCNSYRRSVLHCV